MTNEIEKTNSKSPFDHFINGAKAVIAGIPLPGAGTVASLIDDYVPKSSEAALQRFLSEFEERVKKLEDRLDLDTVNKDEFTDLFKSCYIGVVMTTQEQKIKLFAAMLANLMLKGNDPDKAPYFELDHFVKAINSLSIGALQVMTRVYQACHGQKRPRTTFSTVYKHFSDMIPALVMGLLQELNSLHLVEITTPGVKVERYDNYAIELTLLGCRFVERYIQQPKL